MNKCFFAILNIPKPLNLFENTKHKPYEKGIYFSPLHSYVVSRQSTDLCFRASYRGSYRFHGA
jgi:hypothetical protein